jgi:hypothetical protein
VTTGILLLLASLTPAAGTGTAGMIWLARLWLRCRTDTGGRDSAPESPRRTRRNVSR